MTAKVYFRQTVGGFTETAGTRIRRLLPAAAPQRFGKALSRAGVLRVTDLSVVSAGTAHIVTLMRAIGKTTLSAAAAAGQAVINLTADPGVSLVGPAGSSVASSIANNAIAANDLLAIEKPDGTFHLGTVSSVSTLAITLAANVPTGGVASGAVVWFFGIQTDTDPYTGLPHMSLRPPVSARTVYSAAGGICVAHNRYEPIVLDVDNGTAASVIEYVTLEYAAY